MGSLLQIHTLTPTIHSSHTAKPTRLTVLDVVSILNRAHDSREEERGRGQQPDDGEPCWELAAADREGVGGEEVGAEAEAGC